MELYFAGCPLDESKPLYESNVRGGSTLVLQFPTLVSLRQRPVDVTLATGCALWRECASCTLLRGQHCEGHL